jgi:hypothetical protein
VIAAVIAQVNSDGKRTFTPADFMPSLQEPEREMSLEESIDFVSMLNAAFNGRDERPAA